MVLLSKLCINFPMTKYYKKLIIIIILNNNYSLYYICYFKFIFKTQNNFYRNFFSVLDFIL